MDDTLNEGTFDATISCKVCGEKNFCERDGYYYCNECFTKHEKLRQFEVERVDGFEDTIKHVKKQKIQQAVKNDKPLLTSWECYNYILRGLVDELLNYGAKEEIKLIALQVWAAYLRRMEVAFFNKEHSDLPRLNVRYLKVDVEAIYNHKFKAKTKKPRRKANSSIKSITNDQSNSRELRKSIRKLDESLYSSGDAQSLSSSAATNSVRAIRIRYNTKSRRLLKKTMSSKHLDKHESDVDDNLTCHKQTRLKDLPSLEISVNTMNIKQIYGILGIALNLIEDNIQLCDLIRFIQMGHIGTKNVLQYFPPEWLNNNGTEILRKISFYKYSDKYPDKVLREHIALLCRHIGIKKFKVPNIIKLVQRYVAELCLPSDIALFAERLINLLPPSFARRRNFFYPQYEARAMAYVIFVIKLLYGLDGHKEQILTQNALKINRKIRYFNKQYNETEKGLFVWHDWVHYIEMRKVILGHFNIDLCKQYKQKPSMEQFLQQIAVHNGNDDYANDNDNGHAYGDNNLGAKEFKNRMAKQRISDINAIFTKILSKTITATNIKDTTNENTGIEQQKSIEFKPTLTPATTYLKDILAYINSNEKQYSITDGMLEIPNFMEIDFTQYSVMPYVECTSFIEYFKKKGYKLSIKEIPLTETNRKIVGIFRKPAKLVIGGKSGTLRVEKADFNITPGEWSLHLQRDLPLGMANLEFITELECYKKNYLQKITRTRRRLQIKRAKAEKLCAQNYSKLSISKSTAKMKYLQNCCHKNTSINGYTASIDAFSEYNMDPLPEENLKLRRNLNDTNILENLSDDNTVSDDNDENDETIVSLKSKQSDIKKIAEFCTSKMDYWLLIGSLARFTIPRKKQLQAKFSHSFNWILETCAQTLNIDWEILYEQLLIIEVMFSMGIENLDNFNDCLHFQYGNPIREYNNIISVYRDMW